LRETSSNRSRIERLLSGVRQTKNDTRVAIHLIMPFRRGGCGSCHRALALLPRDTGEAVQLFDAALVRIEFIMGEGYLLQAVVLPSESISLDEVWNRLQKGVEECTKRALQAADCPLRA
jgi:hypothetical protein